MENKRKNLKFELKMERKKGFLFKNQFFVSHTFSSSKRSELHLSVCFIINS